MSWSNLLIVLFLFVVPVLLVYFKVIPAKYRLEVLGSIFLAALLIMIFNGWSFADAGFTLENIGEAFRPYFIFTLVAAAFIFLFSKILKRKSVSDWWRYPHFEYMFIILSFVQEFLYRSFLIPVLSESFNSVFMVVIVNALLFSFLHIIYYDLKYVLPLTLFGGIGFAWLYIIYPNILLITLSHAVLNFLAVFYGFFSIKELKTKEHKIHKKIFKSN